MENLNIFSKLKKILTISMILIIKQNHNIAQIKNIYTNDLFYNNNYLLLEVIESNNINEILYKLNNIIDKYEKLVSKDKIYKYFKNCFILSLIENDQFNQIINKYFKNNKNDNLKILYDLYKNSNIINNNRQIFSIILLLLINNKKFETIINLIDKFKEILQYQFQKSGILYIKIDNKIIIIKNRYLFHILLNILSIHNKSDENYKYIDIILNKIKSNYNQKKLKKLLNKRINKDNSTILMSLLEDNYKHKIIKFFIENGSDLNSKDKSLNSICYYLAKNKKIKNLNYIVSKIIENKINEDIFYNLEFYSYERNSKLKSNLTSLYLTHNYITIYKYIFNEKYLDKLINGRYYTNYYNQSFIFIHILCDIANYDLLKFTIKKIKSNNGIKAVNNILNIKYESSNNIIEYIINKKIYNDEGIYKQNIENIIIYLLKFFKFEDIEKIRKDDRSLLNYSILEGFYNLSQKLIIKDINLISNNLKINRISNKIIKFKYFKENDYSFIFDIINQYIYQYKNFIEYINEDEKQNLIYNVIKIIYHSYVMGYSIKSLYKYFFAGDYLNDEELFDEQKKNNNNNNLAYIITNIRKILKKIVDIDNDIDNLISDIIKKKNSNLEINLNSLIKEIINILNNIIYLNENDLYTKNNNASIEDNDINILLYDNYELFNIKNIKDKNIFIIINIIQILHFKAIDQLLISDIYTKQDYKEIINIIKKAFYILLDLIYDNNDDIKNYIDNILINNSQLYFNRIKYNLTFKSNDICPIRILRYLKILKK